MPTPIGHISVGICIYSFFKNKLGIVRNLLLIFAVIFYSLLPDIYVFSDYFFTKYLKIEKVYTHSFFVLFLLAIPALFTAFFFTKNWRKAVQISMLLYLITVVHVILDLLIGVRKMMLFWPVSEWKTTFPVEVLPGGEHGWAMKNLFGMSTLYEILIFVPVMIVCIFFSTRKNHREV